MAYRPAHETLIGCVYIPSFAVQVERARRPDWHHLPLALVSAGRQPRVVACSPEARMLGIRREMLAGEVIATAPQVVLAEADEPFYRQTFEQIADGLEVVTPLVEIAPPGRAFLGLEGLVNERGEPGLPTLYASPSALMAALEGSVPPRYWARFGIARGKFMAEVAARLGAALGPDILRSASGRCVWVADHARAAVLAPLSPRLLPVSLPVRERLELFGIGTLGGLAQLRLSAVQAQFGREGRRAWLLAQGRDEEPLQPRKPTPEISATLNLPAPEASLPGLLAATREVLDAALRQAAQSGRGIGQVRLEALLETGGRWGQVVTFKKPGTRTDHLFPPVRYLLERTHPPAAVESLTLTCTGIVPTLLGQQALYLEPGEELAAALAFELRQLEARLGRSSVFVIREVEPWSPVPERRFQLVSYAP
jgi:DNA polymerase-4